MAYAYLYNANGDVGQVVDPNAASAAASLVARYEYDPYGGVTALSGSYATRNAIRFSTKPFDPDTGLGYWGYRWYSAKLGRWISRDPIEEKGGANLMRYGVNAPHNSTDPLGLTTFDMNDCLNSCGTKPKCNPKRDSTMSYELESWCECTHSCHNRGCEAETERCLGGLVGVGAHGLSCFTVCAVLSPTVIAGGICVAACLGVDGITGMYLYSACGRQARECKESALDAVHWCRFGTPRPRQ
ncbi:MAG: RHS repeat-associated core domain-containing protein [Phycisphaerales bacterium]|nr:RHS repeat-associated core domain-containing protein [Phycisphaerales bacterium]